MALLAYPSSYMLYDNLYHAKPLSMYVILRRGLLVGHHLYRQRRRLGQRIFKLLLILAIVMGAIYLVRRWNMSRAGIRPKPFFEDVRDMYRQALFNLETGNVSGMIDQMLGRGPASL